MSKAHAWDPSLDAHRWVLRIAGAALALALGVHTAFTLVHVSPMSPLKLRVLPLLTSYSSGLFRQGWSLFAPDPSGVSRHLVFACRGEALTADEHPQDVFSATQKFYDAPWTTRLGPGMKLMRAQLMPVAMLTSERDPLVKALRADPETEKDPALAPLFEQIVEVDERERAFAQEVLGRFAAFECAQQFPGIQLSETYAAVDLERAPKYAERLRTDLESHVKRIEFGWQPYRRVSAW
jgi:hypothetical protein